MLQRLFRCQASLKNNEHQGLFNQITWLKICLTNRYDAKTDFPREKVFIAHSLVKNKVGKMCLFLKMIRVSCFHLKCTILLIKAMLETALL